MTTDQKLAVPDTELRRISSLTALMRHKEAELADIAEQRRLACIRLSKGEDGRQKVTYARLAKAMGISEVAVYKILRKGGPPLRERKEAAKASA
jgi:hypothetical protein